LLFIWIHGSSSGIAAANGEDQLFGNAPTWDTSTAAVEKVSWYPARINLITAANASPTHSIVIIIAALEWA
jgi:hypothetical protein